MTLILNIDTAFETASVSLAENGKVLQFIINENEKDHASWLQPAIEKILQTNGKKIEQLSAVGVNNGPGSYTGLRVGLSSAKGLCYALQIPLITINSLKLLAHSVINRENYLICPMIDARRMEVFTAIFDSNHSEIRKPEALVLHEHCFDEFLKDHKTLFFGSGEVKFQKICNHPNAIFKQFTLSPAILALLTHNSFVDNDFADLAYAEPFYVKEFHNPM
jgi:tRNA threonylcarbamoyladenosine biosynthesis protein TsaB